MERLQRRVRARVSECARFSLANLSHNSAEARAFCFADLNFSIWVKNTRRSNLSEHKEVYTRLLVQLPPESGNSLFDNLIKKRPILRT